MIFLRHPKPDVPAGVCYGQMDIGIGRDGAADIVRALGETPKLARVVASPAMRCRGLAEALATRDGVPLRFDTRLWEMDFGDWEGIRWGLIRRSDSDPWAQDPWNIAPPGGESFSEVHARVAEVISALEPDTAVICHAGPIRAARMILTGVCFEAAFAGSVPYATPIMFAPSQSARETA